MILKIVSDANIGKLSANNTFFIDRILINSSANCSLIDDFLLIQFNSIRADIQNMRTHFKTTYGVKNYKYNLSNSFKLFSLLLTTKTLSTFDAEIWRL